MTPKPEMKAEMCLRGQHLRICLQDGHALSVVPHMMISKNTIKTYSSTPYLLLIAAVKAYTSVNSRRIRLRLLLGDMTEDINQQVPKHLNCLYLYPLLRGMRSSDSGAE